jgi:fumarate hydratase subunit alpha
VFFVEWDEEVSVVGGGLYEAIDQGVREGYSEGFLRKSMVAHPLKRENTGDNTPAIIHLEIVPGDKIKIDFMAKGGGCENMSGLTILAPAAGIAGIKDFVIKRVREAGSNPCPPIIVGIGIGGNFEKAAILSKKALLRPIGTRSDDPDVAKLEEEILAEINKLGIGPQGLGGSTTALSVQIEVFPCHIASLPVAVNIECHSHRHAEVIL